MDGIGANQRSQAAFLIYFISQSLFLLNSDDSPNAIRIYVSMMLMVYSGRLRLTYQLPECMASNALLISAKSKVWVMNSSTLSLPSM